MTVRHGTAVWVVDDDDSMRWVLEKALEKASYETQSFSGLEALRAALKKEIPHALIMDIRLPDGDGIRFLPEWIGSYPDRPVIVVTAHADFQNAVAAYEQGAFEYLPKPVDLRELLAVVGRALEVPLRRPPRTSAPRSRAPLIGAAPVMQRVFRQVGRLARSEVNVLISGESGTGKELVARALHAHSPRAEGPFVAINAAAIPAELLESELFGHERGAFTGAVGIHRGRFEQAQGGTLFFDEIGDMPLALQTRLLRVLAEREFFRVGGRVSISTDSRIIAATHQNLTALVQSGRFREDLYHRLNVVEIHLPPLRERPGDLPLLLEHFLHDAAEELGTSPPRLMPEAVEELQRWPWPGNVRELINFCRKLVLETPGPVTTPADLIRFRPPGASPSSSGGLDGFRDWLHHAEDPAYAQAWDAVERVLIEAALERTGGHRQEAARLLGIGRNTLTRKIARLGLARPGASSERIRRRPV